MFSLTHNNLIGYEKVKKKMMMILRMQVNSDHRSHIISKICKCQSEISRAE